MKKIYSFILITVFNSTVFGQTIPSYVPTNGLVGWWPFNGNANDESGNGNNGTVNGATLTADRFGNTNKAYSFDGVNDYINLPTGMAINSTLGNSYSFWAKTNWNQNNSFFIDLAEASTKRITLDYLNQTDGFEIGFNTNPILSCKFAGNFGQFNNQWIHIATSIDLQNHQTILYINGQSIGTQPLNLSISNISLIAGNFKIGARYDLSTGFSIKELDDIGIWNRALTQQEITALYTANGVGIKDPSQNTLSVYPNPAKTQITLNATTNQIGKTLKVYDALGKVVYETILKQQQYNISITHWANGIYTVAIPEQNLTYKFVKE